MSLAPHQSGEDVEALLPCVDFPLLRERLRYAGVPVDGLDEGALLEAYLERGYDRDLSPNPLFDERWYCAYYTDVGAQADAGGTSGFVHFVRHGLREGRWPNESMQLLGTIFREPAPPLDRLDEREYLRLNPSAAAFIEAFPVLTPVEHYNAYGRRLHFATRAVGYDTSLQYVSYVDAMRAEFDPVYYAATYLRDAAPGKREDPFEHYISFGAARGYSPNDWFNEEWYRAYYADVREAIGSTLTCGFQHYVVHGRIEQRIPRYDLARALEGRMPGVTSPALLPRTDAFRRRLFGGHLRARRLEAPRARPTIWFLMPTLNPDISFGGYRAAYELIAAVKNAGCDVAIYCTDDAAPNKEYFLWRESPQTRATFADIPVLGRNEDDRIAIAPGDRVVAYSVFDMHRAATLANWTDIELPYLLAQEYEAVFFDNSTGRVLCQDAYAVPHYPIINSEPLRKFFEANRIGVFAGDGICNEPADYAVFEHRVNQLPRQSVAALAARTERTMAVYARPELHASRNLFELTVIALQNLCARGVFGPEWSFVGLGALSELPPLDLGAGHRLIVQQRRTEEEYREMLESLDIGVSMMFAPHPGVVAFEFATTGALVVTNTYENRSADDLLAISANIVPCEPSLDGVERAIASAVERADDYEARVRNAYRPLLRSWSEVFSRDFVDRVFRLP